MTRISLSPVAAALLRALIVRAGVERNRVLITDARSMDWQSLTFSGERHHLEIRITGAASEKAAARMSSDLPDWEFSIPGVLVADIEAVGPIRNAADGAADVTIEALTITAD